MRSEAASAGFYESPAWNKKYPQASNRTIAELLQGKRVECPPSRYADATFKKAPRAKVKPARAAIWTTLPPEEGDEGET